MILKMSKIFPLIGWSYCILSLALSMVVKEVWFGVKRHLSEASWQTASSTTMTEEQQQGNDCKTTISKFKSNLNNVVTLTRASKMWFCLLYANKMMSFFMNTTRCFYSYSYNSCMSCPPGVWLVGLFEPPSISLNCHLLA